MRPALLSALGLVLLATIWAALWGAASLFAIEAEATVRGAVSNSEASAVKLRSARAVQAVATRLNPWNPEYLQTLGQLDEQRARNHRPASPEARKLHETALELYREAARLRPTWPYAPVGIARVKAKLSLFDEELRWAVRRAAELGPWELRVQSGLLELGFTAWELLPEDSRDVMRTVLARALESQPRPVIVAAVESYREAEVEPLVTDDEDLEEMLRVRLTARQRKAGR